MIDSDREHYLGATRLSGLPLPVHQHCVMSIGYIAVEDRTEQKNVGERAAQRSTVQHAN